MFQGLKPCVSSTGNLIDVTSDNESYTSEIKEHMLLRPGPLTTPRAVYKSIHYSMRIAAKNKVVEIMKDLEQNGLEAYLQISNIESVFFKPLPTDSNKEKIEALLIKSNWTDYCSMFGKREATRLISEAQFARLLDNSPFQTD